MGGFVGIIVLCGIAYFLVKKMTSEEGVSTNELGILNNPRNIYFADGMIKVDIANKEICIKERWIPSSSIKNWDSQTGGSTPYMNIYFSLTDLPIFEYKTMFIKKQQKLVQALKILDN